MDRAVRLGRLRREEMDVGRKRGRTENLRCKRLCYGRRLPRDWGVSSRVLGYRLRLDAVRARRYWPLQPVSLLPYGAWSKRVSNA